MPKTLPNKTLFLLLLLLPFCKLSAQNITKEDPAAKAKKMEWFKDAKLGIFVHWGIYSVNGVSESWSFFNNYLSHDNYMKQLNGFNAANYNPQEWVKLIKESGAKYSVITSKHHDGVALWDTKANNPTTTLKHAAAKKDLLSPFVTELKKSGLKTGIYFSLPDWSHPDYDVFTRERKRYTLAESPARWNKFITYYHTQLNEISTSFKPDLLWFDGDWEHSGEEWQSAKVLSNLRKYNPNIIVNSRLNHHGDYETPEQGIPVLKPDNDYWELCYTMNDSWGYQPYDDKYKSPNMIIRTLVDCISMGGNLLLDIGPKADGTIPEEQVNILKQLGRWTNKHAEAIYGTRAGIPASHFSGKTALSKDKKTLYLYADWASKSNEELLLRNIKSQPVSAKIVGSKMAATFSRKGNDLLFKVPSSAVDQDVTVIALRFDQPIQLQEPSTPNLNFANLKDKSTADQLQLKKLANSLHGGNNPFLNTSLAVDGIGLEKEKNTLSPGVYNWITKNAEALYKTSKGLPGGHYQGASALSADKQTLFLFVEGTPTGPIALKGIKNKISRIRVVGEGTMIEPQLFNKLYWSAVPGIIYIPIPQSRLDKDLTVIAVLLDGPLDLYREKVGAIESNL
ncbi:alpha-L-fucosidase [Pedobacter immunditicola]|uniref:alpha-L-fucosidase n=1 Tax=Pedobacter immunditicola TaxID=3133440 RepID=UPI00309856CD